ncbi:MAG: DUF5011 domain-containing protein [Cyclobacteriaceae bacterium]
MKNIKYLILLILPALLLSGCAEDMPSSTLNTYPTFVFEGDNTISLQPGEAYVEPGVTALEGDTELEVSVSVSSRFRGYSGTSVGTDPDIYFVNYAAETSQGFANTAARTVIVPPPTGDLVSSISGRYNSQVVRSSNGETYPDIDVWIWPLTANTFQISGVIGHFYADGRAYGDLYIGGGTVITVNDLSAGDITATTATFLGFGINADIVIPTFVVDPVAKTINYTAQGNFANSEFVVSMVQK